MFWALSFLFLNAHFFAIPLVLGAYIYQAAGQVRSQGLRPALVPLGLGIGAVVAALLVNLPVSYYIFAISVKSSLGHMVLGISQGITTAVSYFRYLSFPLAIGAKSWGGSTPFVQSVWNFLSNYSSLIFIGLLLLLAVRPKTDALKRLAFTGLFLVPVSLIYYGARPDYPFRDRYYAVFLGFGLAALALMLEHMVQLLHSSRKIDSLERCQAVTIFLLGLLPFSLLAGPNVAIGIWADRAALSAPPENGSHFYEIYRELKMDAKRMLLFINTPISVQDDIPLFYLDYVDGGYAGSYDLQSALLPAEIAQPKIEEFLKKFPDGLIVFDWLLNDSCSKRPLPAGAWNAQVKRLDTAGACVWEIAGASSYYEVCSIAAALDFPPDREPNLCTPAPNLN